MPAGRPSKMTPELIEEICTRIAHGESLVSICQSDEVPAYWTICRWLDENDEFRDKYTRAREIQGDYMDHRIMVVADASQPETANADRIKIDAYKWRAARLAPKKYGDRLNVDQKSEVTVKQDVDLKHLTKDERQVWMALIQKAKKGTE